ncbi:MAG TPA: cysteine desulfurase family protein [Candidatus Kapabacteria bacterium]|nr:cysteine desulfurase family protein [Candidatus Kapabacteria bacterium]
MIYLDNSATTPLAPEVARRMNRWRDEASMGAGFANASSAHRGGQRARVEVEESRERIAMLLGAEPKEIIFTSGGTEANNHALKGYALREYSAHGAWPVLLTTRTEHHAVLHPAEFLARLGVQVIYLDVDADGRLHPGLLRTALEGLEGRPRPLVSVMHANNETGTVNPIAQLAQTAHELGAIFHTDAVQTFGKMSVRYDALGADMVSVSAHKIHGPKGIGAIYVNKEIELEALLHGGAQERNRRGGTEPVELIAGFDEAAALAASGQAEATERIRSLGALLRTLLAEIEGVRFVTPLQEALPHILNVTFNDAAALDGEALIVGMDLEGVAVSNGSACTSGSIQPSHVLSAMGLPPAQAKAAVRFSLSRYTTEQEIRDGAAALRRVVGRMRH